MKLGTILRVGVILLFLGTLSAWAQTQDLPSAPSASKQQQEKPKPQPPPQAPPATTQAPAAPPATPVLEPGPSRPAPAAPQPAATSQAPPAASKPAPPQDDSADKEDEGRITIRKQVDEVNVIFTVTDKHGRFVKNLKQDDFRVLDDNKPATKILSFHSETDLPLRVGLLIDASNSIRDRFRFEQEAAIEFLNQIIRQRYDQAFVVGFDTTAEVTQDFTDNTEQLSRGVRMLRAGGGTALYDAVYFACRDKLAKAEQRGGPVRRAIILLSDGNDNQSRVTREEAIEMAQRAEVIIYTISTNRTGSKELGDRVMERMAVATGGRAFFPFKIEDVANAFAEIQDELRSQYSLAYRPADFKPDGRFRSIDINAADRKNLHVRARKGYYAPTSMNQ